MSRPIGIDLFSGAGGMSLGFEQAGFDVVAAVEIDPIHSAIHEYNFPCTKVICQSVTDVTGDMIKSQAGIGNNSVDVVFGGAPCQGFSLIGQRALDDPRNQLVKDFVRIVKELDASYFVFENVKGITVGKHSAILKELIEEFENIGYQVVTPWKVLNAANYAVPQDRQRLFLMGCKNGLTAPTYPEPTTKASGSNNGFDDLPIGPSVKDALSDIPDAESFDELIYSDAVETKLGEPSTYAKLMRGIDKAKDDFSYTRTYNNKLLTSSLRTEHTLKSRLRFDETEEGKVETISRFFKLPSCGVSNTLRAGTDSARGAFTSPRPIHYKYPRCITVREMARLHGFPDWFRFHSTKWHGARQIGNAVPPPLAKAVAAQIVKALDIKPKRSRKRLSLAAEELLYIDMTQASKRFGIDVPIAQRTRKPTQSRSKARKKVANLQPTLEMEPG